MIDDPGRKQTHPLATAVEAGGHGFHGGIWGIDGGEATFIAPEKTLHADTAVAAHYLPSSGSPYRGWGGRAAAHAGTELATASAVYTTAARTAAMPRRRMFVRSIEAILTFLQERSETRLRARL